MGGGEGFDTDVGGLVPEPAVGSTSAIASSTAEGVGLVELLPHAAVNTNIAAINEIATSARVSRSRSVLTNSIRLKTNYQLFEKYLERRSHFDCAISGQQDQM